MQHATRYFMYAIGISLPALPALTACRTIMLSPAGDANHPGRTLADSFERGLTRQLAEEIKRQLEQQEHVRIIMSHNVGESASQEQKASFANSLDVDLYIALGAYNAQSAHIDTYFYQTLTNYQPTSNRLAFYPFKEMSRKQPRCSCIVPAILHKQFVVSPLLGIPLQALEGISAPAYYIEIGLSAPQNLSAFVDALCRTIQELINENNT